jgi:hypothetical protein
MKMVKSAMTFPRKLHLWKFTTLTTILLTSLLVSVVAGEDASQSTMHPSLVLFGAGARWAARNGTSALFVNWKDNWAAHHLTDGANWDWIPESYMERTCSSITNALQQSGFDVTLAGEIPNSLGDYDLVVLHAYYAIEPRHESIIRDYVLNGGNVVMLAATQAYFTVYSKSRSPYSSVSARSGNDFLSLQEWFGASNYVNEGGSASPAFDNPFGTFLSQSDLVFTRSGVPKHAGFSSLSADAKAIAFWSSGAVFAFTHEYGDGRVYYQSTIEILTSAEYTQPTVSPGISTSISISTDVPSLFVGFAVDVYGALNDTFGNGLRNEPVFLYYAFPGYESWIPVTSDITNELGEYDIKWIPPATGPFTLKAEWKGNATHSGCSDVLSLNTLPYEDVRVFSVESNSTVLAFAFNSTSLELSFSVSGSDGTKGYVELTLAKSIVADATDVRVFLDGKELAYSASSSGDSWLLVFTYNHSTHQVMISLTTSETGEALLSNDLMLTAIAIVLVVAAIWGGVFVYFKKRKH